MPESRKILLLGAGGHCRSVMDSLTALCNYETINLIDYRKSDDTTKDAREDILTLAPIVGNDKDLERLHKEGYTDAFITVGSIGNVGTRIKLYEQLKQIGYQIPNIIDKESVVSPYTMLGEGIYVGKKAVINANTRIGNCAIINTASVIEHDCVIGDFVHVATGSILCGDVNIADRTHIGAGSIIRQGIQIGKDSMIGIGSIVVKDIAEKIVAYGNPCREQKAGQQDKIK